MVEDNQAKLISSAQLFAKWTPDEEDGKEILGLCAEAQKTNSETAWHTVFFFFYYY